MNAAYKTCCLVAQYAFPAPLSGQVMGTSGQTGMAGGDHIHFAMQLDGVQIDPKEWWDGHWIKDHIAKRVDLLGFK